MSAEVADAIDGERLWARHMALARHGATPTGGVNRQALSPEEIAARRELIEWGRASGLQPSADRAGTLFLRLAGSDPDAAPVVSGSHLDSQPIGGKFDGVYGVLAALEVVQAMAERGMVPRRSIDVVAWMNEEGSRFVPGMMGSAAFAGAASLEAFLSIRDAGGTSVGDALAAVAAAFPDVPERPLGGAVTAYVEAHIEQAPLLDRAGLSVGVVTGIQGKRTFRVTVEGEEAHAGTSRVSARKDALLAATRIIQALAARLHDPEDVVMFTVGRIEVRPNAPSVVAGRAIFSVDLRHPDTATLVRLGDEVPAICAAHAAPCAVSVQELVTAMPLEFPESMRDTIRRAAKRNGIRTMDLLSAAGHDARYLHGICPAGMIFVPCKDGISHNEAEWARPEDLYDGARVLAGTLAELATR